MADKEKKGGPGVPINAAAMKTARVAKGWSQKRLAEEVGCVARVIERIESRGTASLSSLVEIAEALGIDPLSLKGSEDPAANGLALYQLPAAVPDFTGRECELEMVLRRLSLADGAVGRLAISGMGGVGKTSLAVKAAHIVKNQYPDAQLLVDLRGMSDEPLTASEAMTQIIQNTRGDMANLPTGGAKLQAVYRSVLAGKRALLLLDNVRDEEQVQHLIDIAPPCAFIVTSRKLLALDGVDSISLGDLPPDQGESLLRAIVRNKGTDDEVKTVGELCGWLPLAIRIAGDFLRLHANWSLSQYTSTLRDVNERLKRLKGGTSERDVEAVLAMSAHQLALENETVAARLEALTVIPGYFNTSLAAKVWGMITYTTIDTIAARDALTYMIDRSLVQLVGGDCYIYHDLMRPIARRVFDYTENHRLASTSDVRLQIASFRLNGRRTRGITLDQNGRMGEVLLEEHPTLSMGSYINKRLSTVAAPPIVAINMEILMPKVADDSVGSEDASLPDDWLPKGAGKEFEFQGDMVRALECYEQWLMMSKRDGNRSEEVGALLSIGRVRLGWSAKKAVEDYFEPALRISKEIGDRRAEARSMLALASSPRTLIELEPLQYAEQSLRLFEELDDTFGIGQVRKLFPNVTKRA